MSEVLKANVFFFIASVAAVVFAIALAVALFYIARAARELKLLIGDVRTAFRNSEEFITDLVDRFESNRLFSFFFPKRVTRSKSSAETKRRKQ
jgi:hypothetical protein